MTYHIFYRTTRNQGLLKWILCSLLMLSCSAQAANDIELPSIGRINPLTIQEEKRLGSAWLTHYRRQVPIAYDPIINDYLEILISSLAIHSQTNYDTLSLVVAKHNSLNAFAVPGGIIGVHTGLFAHAKTEAQLASVLAHELAHLSQRHYARGVEKQKGQSFATIAGFLASLILVTTSNSDAGVAALSATQAYAIGQQLRFSRSFEREADRIGMDILVKAGIDPHATEEMFEQMDRLTRFSSKPPEFLLTHPLTTNRIIDAVNLARAYPKRVTKENINYQLVRARAILETEESPQQAIIRFRNELSGFDTSIDGSRYGLVTALTDNEQFDEAQEKLDILLRKYPHNRILHMSQNAIFAGQGDLTNAIKQTLALIKQHPHYYPLSMQLSQFYRLQRDYEKASQVLITLAKQRSNNPSIWYELAEVSGLNGRISLLHKARTEFFILHGDFDNAEQQLTVLLEREEETTEGKASELHRYATTRLSELKTLRERNKL